MLFKHNNSRYIIFAGASVFWIELNEIVTIAPPFLRFTKRLSTKGKNDDILKAFKEDANVISNTRNMFAHAKTSYEKKGMECPTEQPDIFLNY